MKFSLVCLGLAACIAVVHCQFGGDSFLNLMMMQRMLGGSARGASGGANPLSALMGTGATGAGASTSGGSNYSPATDVGKNIGCTIFHATFTISVLSTHALVFDVFLACVGGQ